MVETGEFQELDEERRPYAPAANVVAVLERVRRVNLPDVVDTDLLRIAGVSEGAMTRVVYALRFLRLTEANGRPSDRLRAIARAPEEDWRDLLAGVIREAYASDFARLDPGQDTQPRIVSAFKRYEPRSQTERMVMLFLGLCRAAGIPVLDAPRERQMQARPGGSRPRSANGGSTTSAKTASRAPSRANASVPAIPDQFGSIPSQPSPLLFGVTVDDIGSLEPEQFKTVWDALGVIARARAMSLKAARDMAEQAASRRENEAQEAQEGEPDQ
jgi:hypothetical protein